MIILVMCYTTIYVTQGQYVNQKSCFVKVKNVAPEKNT